MPFQVQKQVRFAHCDPAGIVFYPRYTALVNEVVEDWFAGGLGVGFPELHEQRGLGIPVVRLEMDFLATSRYGERLDFTLRVRELGRSSALLEIDAACGGEPRIRARLKVVLMSLATHRAVPFDDDWRARLSPFVEPSGA
jgi:4-hydroxybenzoyl-CoA thioesterase